MKSNLAHEPPLPQGQVVHFPKKEQKVMADKFEKGYVMSSRLYRHEVRPFLSDAAKNVYAELEDRINGFQDKITDHVSYSQLQGGKLPGSKKLGTATVRRGLKELLDLGVISIVSESSRKGNEYRINEVSLVEHFQNKSTTSKSEALPKVKRQNFQNESASTFKTEDTIESFIELLENNNNYKTPLEFQPQDRGALNFIDYHSEDPKLYSLKDLSSTYSIKKDFMAQAAVSFPKLSQDIVLEQLKELAQWSVGQPERISQKWMTTWLNWLRNYQPVKPKAEKTKSGKKSNVNLNVNDAWKDQAPNHALVKHFQVDIPEDFV